MAFQRATRTLLTSLRGHPEVRQQIRAAPGRTLLYAGSFFKPMWQEVADYRRTHPEVAQKQTLPDVLARITSPGTPHASLLAYVQNVEGQVHVDPTTKDLLAYFQRCIQSKQSDINVGFISA